jgi:uncharacterized protein (DUF2336 family)
MLAGARVCDGGRYMTGERSALTSGDVAVLTRGLDVEDRAVAAHKICRRIDAHLDESEREAAEEVLRLMALDAADLVRRALAVTLKASKALPRDVALKLAADIDSVATPVLTSSPVFTDADLAEIVQASTAIKQMAIARRDALSETVTSALAEHAPEAVVQVACSNDNARFSETGLRTALDRFAGSEPFATAVALRRALPPAIAERLVDLVSDQVKQLLIDRHALAPDVAMSIAVGARERATIDLVEQAGQAADLKGFTAHLRRAGRLSPSLLLRTVAQGNMSFFEWALAELAGVAHHRVWIMVHDGGPLGLRAICAKAGMPETLYPAFRVGVDTYHQLQKEGADFDLAVFQRRMLERFLTQEVAAPEDVDYLLERMDSLDAAAEDHAKVA